MSTTTAGAAAQMRGPRRGLVLTLLALSVALNLFFVAGAVWIRLHGPARPGPDQRYEQMAAELGLNAQQRAEFDSYVVAMRARTDQVHQEVGPLIAAAWREIAKPQADVAQVMRLLDEAGDKRREFQREATRATLGFLSVLSPTQRDQFVTIAREHRAPWLRHRRDSR